MQNTAVYAPITFEEIVMVMITIIMIILLLFGYIHWPFAWFQSSPAIAELLVTAAFPNCPNSFSHLLCPLGQEVRSDKWKNNQVHVNS